MLSGSVAVVSEGEALPVMGREGDAFTLTGSWIVEESADPLRDNKPGVGMRRLPAAGGVLLEGESGLKGCWDPWGGGLSEAMATFQTRQIGRPGGLGAAMHLQSCVGAVHKPSCGNTKLLGREMQNSATGRDGETIPSYEMLMFTDGWRQ